MFKNMKLSSKIAFGFGALLIVLAFVGVLGWVVLSQVKQTVGLAEGAQQNAKTLLYVRCDEKDFSIYGFEKQGADSKDSVQKWQERLAGFREGLNTLTNNEGMENDDVELTRSVLTQLDGYEKTFGSVVESNRMRDEAFQTWGKLGWNITDVVGDAIDTVINPAMDQARQAKNADI